MHYGCLKRKREREGLAKARRRRANRPLKGQTSSGGVGRYSKSLRLYISSDQSEKRSTWRQIEFVLVDRMHSHTIGVVSAHAKTHWLVLWLNFSRVSAKKKRKRWRAKGREGERKKYNFHFLESARWASRAGGEGCWCLHKQWIMWRDASPLTLLHLKTRNTLIRPNTNLSTLVPGKGEKFLWCY